MNDLINRLESVSEDDDFSSSAEGLIEEWEEEGGSFEDVPKILSFMENNPKLDYGVPGPLVHYVEKFFGSGYESELVKSVSRKPVIHTVWMLNRVINGVKHADLRSELIAVLSKVMDHAEADLPTRKEAAHFLERLMIP